MALHKIEGLEVSLRKGLHIIKFNRPSKKNSFTPQMYKGITDLLNAAAEDDRVVVTALTGASDFYSSGNDMVSAAQANASEDSDRRKNPTALVKDFVTAFINYPKLLIAVVNGPAIGIAATTLGLCDVVYASDKAYFLTPFTKLGLVAEGCSSYLFPRIMGISKASEMLYFGHQMSAHEALQCGLVSKLFPHATFEKEVWPKVEGFAQMPKQSMFASKRLVRSRLREDLHKANDEECRELEERMQSEECANAVIEFLSKRSKM